MSRAVTMVSVACIGILLSLTMAAGQGRSGDVAKELIGITKGEWAAAMAKDISDATQILHDECTMFVPDFPNRLDGKDAIYKFRNAQASGSGSMVMAEMANEKVQVYGDTAVLSYNFMGMRKDGEGKVEAFRQKSTRVYVKEGGKWLLVHANFAPVEAPGS